MHFLSFFIIFYHFLSFFIIFSYSFYVFLKNPLCTFQDLKLTCGEKMRKGGAARWKCTTCLPGNRCCLGPVVLCQGCNKAKNWRLRPFADKCATCGDDDRAVNTSRWDLWAFNNCGRYRYRRNLLQNPCFSHMFVL